MKTLIIGLWVLVSLTTGNASALDDARASDILGKIDAELGSERTPVLDGTVDAVAAGRLAGGPAQRLAHQLRVKLLYHAGSVSVETSLRFVRQARRLAKATRADLRIRANLAVGTWPVQEDTTVRQLFVDFVKLRHPTGPPEVWYRYEPAHPAKFLEQGNTHVSSTPIFVDVTLPGKR